MAIRSSAVHPAAVGPMLLAALGAASVGAVLLSLAPALPVVTSADGADAAPAFTAGPLLAVLALAPVALAWLLAARGRPGTAAGLLAGLAAVALGRTVLDLQLVVDPWQAARPELLVPTSLAPLRAGAGAWVLVLGHLLTVAAGVLAVRRGATDLAGGTAPRPASGAFTSALCLGAVAAVGLVAAPMRSADPFLVPRSAVDSPLPTMIGLLLTAAAVVLAACLAASAADREAGRGGLTGVGLGVAAVVVPAVAAVAFSPALSPTWGPWIALAGAAGLLGVGRTVGRVADQPEDHEDDAEVSLPALDRLIGAAGVAAVLAGLAAVLGALARQVVVPDGVPEPVLYPTRLLVPAGLLLGALGGVLLARRRTGLAVLVRPALAAAWAGMALAAAAVLDAGLTALEIEEVGAGFGLWAAGVALLAAPVAGVLAAVAGWVERDEADLSELRAAPASTIVGAAAAALAVAAFGLPLLTGPGYAQAGLWSNFGVASWGLLVAVVTVVAAALLAPRSRPSRAVGLLLGAAAVVVLHLAQVPLTGGRTDANTAVGAGTWFALACLAALLVGAGLAGHRHRAERADGERRRAERRERPRMASTLRGGRGSSR